MTDWYEEYIEAGIRDAVRLLRDNGFNTTCSCEHEMIVQGDLVEDGELNRLHNLLTGNGHRNYKATITLEAVDLWPICRFEIQFQKESAKC